MRPTYIKEVEKLLSEYVVIKESWELDQRLEAEGLGRMFPSLTPAYEDSVRGYSEYRDSTERYGILRAMRSKKEAKIRMVEESLNLLDPAERELIERKYLHAVQPPDEFVARQMRYSRSTYFRIKRSALRKLALAWNLVDVDTYLQIH